MDKIKRIKELVELLNKASYAYYNTGNTIMTDQEFDSMMEELKYFEQETGFILSNSPTQKVGVEVKAQLNKVKHTRPMLSLDKCHTTKELIEFAGNDPCYMSVKCDGLTTRLIYENGELIGAETRGDGEIGQDVFLHVKNYINVPLKIPYTNRFVIDGESVIFNSDFIDINANLSEDEQFANPRNLASGTLSNLDTNITKQRHMRFIAWRVIEGDNIDSNFLKLKRAEMSGFTIAPIYTYQNGTYDELHIEDMLHSLRKTANDMGLPMDGVVMAKDSEALAISMGRTSKFFRHSIAYKFDDEGYETELEYIDWTLGRTGILTPTAVFKTIEIDGSEISRASMHNLSVMAELSNKHVYYKGMKLIIYKANQIIPQVRQAIGNLDEEINSEIFNIPIQCPICGVSTAIQKDNDSEVLVCINPNCSGKLLGRFTHFVSKKAMNIEGLSSATLELLISNGYISKFKDIYHLSEHANELAHLPGLGAKSVEKLLLAIEKSREVKLENFICALGIPNIGLSAAKSISKKFGGDHYDFVYALDSGYDFSQLEDFGEIMNKSLHDWWESKDPMVELLPMEIHFIVEEDNSITNDFISGKTFCVTGAFHTMKRSEIEKIITERGGKLSSSVSKKTDFLLTNDAGSGSTKALKAAELGIPVMSEEEFLEKCGE